MNRTDKLTRLIVSLIAEEKANTLPQYRDEIKDIENTSLDRSFKRDFCLAASAVEAEDLERLSELHTNFLELAKEYAKPWYDEDLDRIRGGYIWESNFYKALADICE